MDILAHGLWAGAAAQMLQLKKPSVDARATAAMVAFAVAPDVIAALPAVASSFSVAAPLQFLYAHITAVPGVEPPMPAWAEQLGNLLHCIMHSVIVAGVVTALAYWKRPSLMLPLAGWWLHIALDVPTHSDDYYAVPLFYPLTLWGVDGVAWTEPWMLALNYMALGAAYLWLWCHRKAKFAAGERIGPAK